MSDPVDTTKPAASPGTTAIVVKNARGEGTSVRLKNEKGQWVKKHKPMPVSSQEIKRIGRKALMKIREGGKSTEMQALIETGIKWANYRPPEGFEPDPKMVAASKQWADWLMLNFVGKPGPTEEDKEDNKLSGVKYVLIQQPQLMHEAPIEMEDRFKPPEKPTFIDAEIVSTNEPEK